MNSSLQKKQLENMMKEPESYKRVSIVRLCMQKEAYALYGLGRITGAEQAADMVRPLFAMADRELMAVMSVDAKLQPMAVEIAAVGGVNACQIDIRNIFKHAILSNAAYVICFHNHLSGDPEPSREDYSATENIRQAGEILGIHLIDHIVIGGDGFYSFRENGRLGRDKADYAA